MFGGAGLYKDGLMFGLIADDVLYFRVDGQNKPAYEHCAMQPFRPFNKEAIMPYYEVPPQVLDDRDAMGQWAAEAYRAAKLAKMK
jgi:DNA transformation protein